MKVAVIIPCRNEELFIKNCVDSILSQDYNPDGVRIYIVDGCSEDRTLAIVQQEYSSNQRVFVLLNEKKTTPYALNLGIENAKADVVIIFGAHAIMHPQYIAKCVEVLQNDHSVACVGGIIENVNQNETAQVVSDCMSSAFGVGNAHFRTGNARGYVDTVAFGAYRSAVLTQVGVFNSALTRNQDDELNYRITKAGFRIFLDPEIRSSYFVRGSFKKLALQYYQYGYWKVYVNVMHHTITTWRQLIPFFFVAYLASAGLGLAIWPKLWMLMLAPLAIYIMLGGFISLRMNAMWPRWIARMGVFAILHVSYGWGYTRGIFRFVLLRRPPEIQAGNSSR